MRLNELLRSLLHAVNELTRDREQQDRTEQHSQLHDSQCVYVFLWATDVCFTHYVFLLYTTCQTDCSCPLTGCIVKGQVILTRWAGPQDYTTGSKEQQSGKTNIQF